MAFSQSNHRSVVVTPHLQHAQGHSSRLPRSFFCPWGGAVGELATEDDGLEDHSERYVDIELYVLLLLLLGDTTG